jgi:hypothetical protein
VTNATINATIRATAKTVTAARWLFWSFRDTRPSSTNERPAAAFSIGNRSGRGQIAPCLTDEAHRPLPERRSCVSRYASARTLRQRSLRRSLQVESSYLLCLRANAIVGLSSRCVVYPICQGTASFWVVTNGGPTSNRKRSRKAISFESSPAQADGRSLLRRRQWRARFP